MKNSKRRWRKIVEQKKLRVPFKKEYCVCGKLSFSKGEAERFRRVQLDGKKKKAHIYECPESFDYHLTYIGR